MKTLAELEWEVGHGQCPVCFGFKADHFLHSRPEGIKNCGHLPGCGLAAVIPGALMREIAEEESKRHPERWTPEYRKYHDAWVATSEACMADNAAVAHRRFYAEWKGEEYADKHVGTLEEMQAEDAARLERVRLRGPLPCPFTDRVPKYVEKEKT